MTQCCCELESLVSDAAATQSDLVRSTELPVQLRTGQCSVPFLCYPEQLVTVVSVHLDNNTQ